MIFDKDITNSKIKVYGGKNLECDGKMCTFTNATAKSLNKDENFSVGMRNSEAKNTEINIVGIQFNDETICGSIDIATPTPTTATPITTPTTTSATTTGMIFLLGAIHKRHRNILGGGGSQIPMLQDIRRQKLGKAGQNCDMGEGGIKNDQKNPTSFMDGS